MAPNLSEDEIDDLIYLARAGEDADLTDMLQETSGRDNVTPAEVLAAARDGGNATCLHMAAANGHAKIVTLILSYLPSKSSVAAAGTNGAQTSVPSAATQTTGSSDSDSQLAPAGEGEAAAAAAGAETTSETPYINVQNTYGNTALHWACLGGHLDVVKLLLSRGASPTVANDKDQIPLDLAAFNSHMHVVEYFLSQSKDIEGTNATEGGLEKGAEDVQMGDDDEEAGKQTGQNGVGSEGQMR